MADFVPDHICGSVPAYTRLPLGYMDYELKLSDVACGPFSHGESQFLTNLSGGLFQDKDR